MPVVPPIMTMTLPSKSICTMLVLEGGEASKKLADRDRLDGRLAFFVQLPVTSYRNGLPTIGGPDDRKYRGESI